ncbi:glycerol kinase [Cellvibrio mixtus]|uniref:Glycerol kinase n=1 Tax=Cellvibrio mixtus TaxID=39650 RepID=A0A266Q7B5_9GAMM|nr:FGGY family carbohydrate kinase [Cellvibrio mixtus]OZY85710.1 glycerol kinase [Cellvibrio mixtus]
MPPVFSSQFNNNLHLAIDQGGQSTRVAIYTSTGQQICAYSSPCATQHSHATNSTYPHIEQNAAAILAGIRDSLHSIQQYLGADVQYIASAGFAGQGSSLLCWNNRTGDALTPVLSWQDIRGEPYLAQFPLDNQELQQLTGLRLSPHYGASKMRWCLEHSSAVIAAQHNHCLSIGPIVSYLFWHLLDQPRAQHPKSLIDPGHAQRTLLWNLQRNEWESTLLEHFKIPRAVLPECLHHNSHFGDLLVGDHSIPFTACARDQGASLFARGLPQTDCVYINIGTGAFIQRLSDKLQAPDGLLVSPLWFPESKHQQTFYAWEATVNGAAAAIGFMQEQTGLAITPADINAALELNPAGDCYLLNAVGGLSAPYWRTDLQSHFSQGLSPQEKILAWIESVIFQIVINVQLMNSLGPVQKIIISGGFSKADAVCQKIADLTHANIHRSDNADATLQGTACMAAGLPESWKPLMQEDVFVPQENPVLSQRFSRWQGVMQQWLSARV